MMVKSSANTAPSDVQPYLDKLVFEWSSDPDKRARYRDRVWQQALGIAEIAGKPKKPLGFSRRHLRALEAKLRSAAKDYADLSSRVEGLTPHGGEALRSFANEIKNIVISRLTPRQLAKMNPETEQIVRLIDTVFSCTGDYHLRELAHILHAAYEKRGLSDSRTSRITPEGLDTTYRRYKKNIAAKPRH